MPNNMKWGKKPYKHGGHTVPGMFQGNSHTLPKAQSGYFGTHDLPGFDDGGPESQIYFTSKVAAQYIGECYINRTHINLATQPRPPWMIDFELKGTHEDWIDLETYFTVTFDDESWSSKVFEFFKREINYNNDSVKLRAIETQV